MNHSVAGEDMEESAALYAFGALSQLESRAFDEHLAEGCDICDATLREFESVVAELAYDAAGVAPPSTTRAKLMARLETESSHRPSPPSLEFDYLHPVIVRSHEGEWQKMSAGILFKQLFVDPTRKTVTSLLKLKPGASIPMHRHRGVEECYVIEGDVSANNETLNAGDYTCAMADSIHHPISTINGALLLIVAPESFEVIRQ